MKELFVSLGATKRQMEIFLKMLSLGAQPASVIARHMAVPRSTMYLYLDELKKLGLVDEFVRAGIKYFKCVPVSEIGDLLNSSEAKIQHARKVYNEKLADLERLESKLSITPKIIFYEGKDAVMKMYEEVLKEDSFYSFFNPQVDNLVLEIYFKKIDEEIVRRELNVKELVVDGKKARKYFAGSNSKNHKIKFLPKGVSFDSDNLICKDRIFMVSYGETEVSAVKIQSETLANSYRVIFEQLWGRIK